MQDAELADGLASFTLEDRDGGRMEADGGVIAEVVSKHGHSKQPESQQVLAVLQAVVDVIKLEGLPVTPASLFAATMSAMEKPETQSAPQVALAMCTLLGFVLPRLPNSILRSKFMGCSQIIGQVLEKHRGQAATAKAALGCLCHMLSALDPANWPAAMAPYNLLLSFIMDGRPKVRKRAQVGLAEVLAALQRTPALAPASEAIAKVCQAVLPRPEAAARAAAAASNKQRSAAEEAITQAVADALHLINALKMVLALLSAQAVKVIVDLLFKLYPLRQPLLSRHTTEALAALCSSSAAHLAPATLAEILTVVVDSEEQLWDRRDADGVLSLTRLVESGFARLHELDAQLCAQRLPRAFHALVPQLGAEQDGVRFGTSQALRNLIKDCVGPELLSAAAAAPASSPVVSIVAAVASTLGARYQEAWSLSLPVAGELLEQLGGQGPAAAQLATPLLQALGSLLAGAADAADEGGADAGSEAAPSSSLSYYSAAEAALGQGLRTLGPARVLEVLPLNLIEGMDGAVELRTWLLPLLRRYVRGGPALGYWRSALLPLARALAVRAEVAKQAGRGALSQSCYVLELQLWHCLPSFASWATDLPESYPAIVKDLAGACTARADLAPSIYQTLQRMCLQVRKALRAAGDVEMTGFGEPLGAHEEEDEDEYGASMPRGGKRARRQANEEDEAHTEVPEGYDAEVAKAAAGALRQFSKNWLPLLCSNFLKAEPEGRGHVAAALSAYAAISDPRVLAPIFKTAVVKLIKIVEDSVKEVPPPDMVMEGGQDPLQRQCAFMDLALCMGPGLDDVGLATLFKAAKPGLVDKEAAVQKKAYRILAYICEQRPAFFRQHLQEIVTLVTAGTAASLSAAKRYRLRCLKPLALLLGSPSCPDVKLAADGDDAEDDDEELSPDERRRQLIAVLVGEIVLCVKEANKKTRSAAYELLVQVAHAMDEARPATGSQDDDDMAGSKEPPSTSGATVGRGGLYDFLTMVMAGLVGTTPHMISATVMALARLLYEFASQLEGLVPQLLPAVLMLLRTKSREVVKSVLGFVKVCAMRMPVDVLSAHLGPILEGLLLWSEDSKNKFRLKVRIIVERLAKRCGFDAMADKMPASDSRLLTHIRKEHNRKQRRRNGEGAAEGPEEEVEEDARSRRTGAARSEAARTARASQWAHTNVFSDEESSDGEDDKRSRRSFRTHGGRSAHAGGPPQGGANRGGKAGARLTDTGDDPMNLLDASASRQLVKSAAGVLPHHGAAEDDFTRNEEGKMVIDEDDFGGRNAGKRKRRADNDGEDSDSDADFDDLKGRGGSRTVRFAKSTAGESTGGRSRASSFKSHASKASMKTGPAKHSGDRFKAKGKATGGDVKGRSKVEPYAYWQFDRKMLNRRRGKQASASKSLTTVVRAAKAGAAKGLKGRRTVQQTKRQRTE